MQSKIKFIQNGNTTSVIEFNENQVKDDLNTGVYMLCFSQEQGYYLTYVKDKFELPSKLYGSTNQRANRILKAFNNSTKGTGVLCTGDKGSGKTLLMSKVCNDSNLPIILINSCHYGSQFELFINRLGKCILLFDEFGKVYKRTEDTDPQESILSLLDGATSNKRLVLLTENDSDLINSFILGRGGRVRYHFEYNKLEEEVITHFCMEQGCSDDFVAEVLQFCRTSTSFSFDTLVTLVKEHKEFGEQLEEFLPFINVDCRDKTKLEYIVTSVVCNEDNKDMTEVFMSKLALYDYSDYDFYLRGKDSKVRIEQETGFDIIKHFVSKQGNDVILNNGDFTIAVIEHKVQRHSDRAF